MQRASAALAALGFATFAIGTAEFIAIGILNEVSGAFDVSAGRAGLLTTSYALAIAVGGPLAAAASLRVDRRRVLLVALAGFVAANVLAATATTFPLLVATRLVAGTFHGLFIGTAFGVAAMLVAPSRAGVATAVVLAGIALAGVLGVPLGTRIGQLAGWQAAFALIAGLAGVAMCGVGALVPPRPTTDRRSPGRVRAALSRRVAGLLTFGFLLSAAQFVCVAYLDPLLRSETAVADGALPIFLFVYGAGTALGAVLGGRLADANPRGTLLYAGVGVVGGLALLFLGAPLPGIAAAALFVLGLSGWILLPALQIEGARLAGRGGDLAGTLVPAAVTAGIAAGSFAGGLVIAAEGPRAAVLVATLTAAVTVAAAWSLRRLV